MERQWTEATEQMRVVAEPVRRWNTRVLDQTERLVQYRLERAQEYARLGLDQLRAALAVSSPEDVNRLLVEQQRGMTVFTDEVAREMETLASMGQEFQDELQRFWRETGAALPGVPARGVAGRQPESRPEAPSAEEGESASEPRAGAARGARKGGGAA